MKLSRAILAGALGLSVVSPLQAQTRPGFEVGVQLFDYSYRERVEGSVVVRDDGKFVGLTASYVQPVGSGWFLRGDVESAFGSVDYSSEDGEFKDVNQDVTQIEFHVGRDIQVGPTTTITPFVGIGGRALEDESGGEETELGFLGYDRRIGYTYIPAGLAMSVPFGSRLGLTFSAQYNWVVAGTAKSKFSEVDPDFPDVKLDLDGGHGFEASAMLSAPLGRRAVRFGPFLRHWNIDQSKSKVFREEGEEVEFFEPANKTTEAGLRITFAF